MAAQSLVDLPQITLQIQSLINFISRMNPVKVSLGVYLNFQVLSLSAYALPFPTAQ